MARENLIGDNAGAWNAVLKVAWDELGDRIYNSPDCMRILDLVRKIRAYNGRQGGNSVRRREHAERIRDEIASRRRIETSMVKL